MTPVLKRPVDLILICFFAVSVTYGFLFSLPEGLGVPVAPDSPWPPLRALHDWAVAEEPAHLDPPANLIAACLFDGFFQAPVTHPIGSRSKWDGREALQSLEAARKLRGLN